MQQKDKIVEDIANSNVYDQDSSNHFAIFENINIIPVDKSFSSLCDPLSENEEEDQCEDKQAEDVAHGPYKITPWMYRNLKKLRVNYNLKLDISDVKSVCKKREEINCAITNSCGKMSNDFQELFDSSCSAISITDEMKEGNEKDISEDENLLNTIAYNSLCIFEEEESWKSFQEKENQ